MRGVRRARLYGCLGVAFVVFALQAAAVLGEEARVAIRPLAGALSTAQSGCTSFDEAACLEDPSCRPAYAPPCAILRSPLDKPKCHFKADPRFLSCEALPQGCTVHEDEASCASDARCVPYSVDACASQEEDCPTYAACLDKAPLAPIEKPEPRARSLAAGRGVYRNLRVLYYNLYWGNASKYQVLSNLLLQKVQEGTAPDLVLIQEAFFDEGSATGPYPVFRQMLGTAYPYQVPGPLRSGSRLFGSGLVVLSRVPIVGAAALPYAACAGIDCYSRKGAELAVVRLGSDCGDLAVFNTHTQAGKRGDYWPLSIDPPAARLRQVNELAAFVRQLIGTTATVPVIAGGDFNLSLHSTDPSDVTAYRILTEQLGLVNAEAYCSIRPAGCRAPYPIGSGLTPLIGFTRGSPSRGVSIAPLEFIKHPPSAWGGLSDHSLLEVTYRLTCAAISTEQ